MKIKDLHWQIQKEKDRELQVKLVTVRRFFVEASRIRFRAAGFSN